MFRTEFNYKTSMSFENKFNGIYQQKTVKIKLTFPLLKLISQFENWNVKSFSKLEYFSNYNNGSKRHGREVLTYKNLCGKNKRMTTILLPLVLTKVLTGHTRPTWWSETTAVAYTCLRAYSRAHAR